MSSKSTLPYATRAKYHSHPVARLLFRTAVTKKSNLILSADMLTTKSLLDLADLLGPDIAVFKTHIDMISDLAPSTITSLKALATKHDFLIFEDRKFIDIGKTVQHQYHGGALHISEFAHIVNASVLGGEGIIDALEQVIRSPAFPYKDERKYTRASVAIARKYRDSVIGFVATKTLSDVSGTRDHDEDFVVFTTGVNASVEGDSLGQRYQTPTQAVKGGSDFVIVGRGIYAAEDPVEAAKMYQKEAWDAYLVRTGQK
ncbi:orotidine-5'-monophosphate decarboxylase [Mollisia scopiformis]|uniref:Orotidine 5'-phosphate decarboxylase n=1 Tax=Mollisia scopiformis TaxID=149040 RepID=A0A194WV06_MOLSC|nr:orotidine-5'-monophosphate decarboxylase [Mollisia scopiformis]KUJ11499.1 orotidine-5'-monophosphate decarboxylase [Mollisia scopiformis]